ncbi:uncharacterized protein METZ01_LOCUS134486 [marine metagenome]|uniref:Uncharacterized protein n=1 Tax=marine metagenome TaxID=408172 RepID=A0A381YYC6_9ZZZZ
MSRRMIHVFENVLPSAGVRQVYTLMNEVKQHMIDSRLNDNLSG